MSAEATLNQIAESSGSLLKLVESNSPVAEREVKMLQTALDFVLSSNEELKRTKKAQQCQNVLARLSNYTRSTPHAATGDTDDVTPLGFDKYGSPTLKATQYIEKAIEVVERSSAVGKGKKGNKQQSGESTSPKKEDEDTSAKAEKIVIPAPAPPASVESPTSVLSPQFQLSQKQPKKKRRTKGLAMQSPDLGPVSPAVAGASISPFASDDEDNQRSYNRDSSLAEVAQHSFDEEDARGISDRKAAAQKNKQSKAVQLLAPLLTKVKKGNNNGSPSPKQQNSSSKASFSSPNGGKKKGSDSFASPKSTTSNKAHDNTSVRWKWSNIPLTRRLQTLVVSALTFFTGLPFFIALFFFLCCFKYTLPFMVIYLVYIFIVFPRTHKHPLKAHAWWRQSWVFEQYRDYFPIRLVVPKNIRKQFDPNGNYFFIYHPHGIHSFGAVVAFGADVHGISQMLPGIKFHIQTLGAQFWVPFWRELVVLAGSGDASAKCIKNTLNAGPGHSPVLVVGGAEESLLSSPKSNVLCLMKRKGFVRIALETGKPLVPVFAFGETNVYYNYAPHVPRLKEFLLKMQKKLKFAIPIFVGRGYFNYSFGMLPHRRPINCVVGEPLVVPHIPKPTKEEVDYWHGQYVEALINHYNTHKGVYDLGGELVIQ